MKSIVSIALFSLFLFQALYAQETVQWRGPQRDGIYTEKNLLRVWPESGPDLVWKYEGLGKGFSSAVVTSNRVYITGTIDSISNIFAFDFTGNLLWKKPYGREWMKTYPGVRTTPLICDGRGYILSGLGVLYCFNAENGDIIWTKDFFKDFDGKNIPHGISENLLIDGEKLFCVPGGVDANVVALNRITGDVIWISKGNGEVSAYSNPLLINIDGKKFFITMTFKTVLSINAENGDVAWKYDSLKTLYGIHANTPFYRDGYLFIQDGYERGCMMFKITNGGYSAERIWKNDLMDETQGHAVIIDDRIYGAAESKKMFCCLDWYTGKVLFTTDKIADGTTVIADDGLLYCCTYGGKFSLVKPTENSFEVISTFQVGSRKNDHISHPVIKDGRLYVRHENTLWVYSIAAK